MLPQYAASQLVAGSPAGAVVGPLEGRAAVETAVLERQLVCVALAALAVVGKLLLGRAAVGMVGTKVVCVGQLQVDPNALSCRQLGR